MRFRLTKTAKILLSVILAIVVIAGVVFGLKSGLIKNDIKDKASKNKEAVEDVLQSDNTEEAVDDSNIMTTDKKTSSTINISLDEWIGWKSIIDANGGLTTQKGSIYDELGIDVNISVINDATQ